MPNWADENGNYWWAPPGTHWTNEIKIPHAPVEYYDDCKCPCCEWQRNNPRKDDDHDYIDQWSL